MIILIITIKIRNNLHLLLSDNIHITDGNVYEYRITAIIKNKTDIITGIAVRPIG